MAARILRSGKAAIAATTEADFWHGARMATDALAPGFRPAALPTVAAAGNAVRLASDMHPDFIASGRSSRLLKKLPRAWR